MSSGGAARKSALVDDATLEYYARVERILDKRQGATGAPKKGDRRATREDDAHDSDDSDDDDEEDFALFVGNVLSEVRGHEVTLSQDTQCSRVLEKLMHAASPFQRRVFLDSFAGQMARVCRGQYSSHLVQTTLQLVAQTAVRELERPSHNGDNDDNSDDDDDNADADEEEGTLPSAAALIVRSTQELLLSAKMAKLVYNPYASHVLRLILQILSGAEVELGVMRSRNSVAYAGRVATAARQVALSGDADMVDTPKDGDEDATSEQYAALDAGAADALRKMRQTKTQRTRVPDTFIAELLRLVGVLLKEQPPPQPKDRREKRAKSAEDKTEQKEEKEEQGRAEEDEEEESAMYDSEDDVVVSKTTVRLLAATEGPSGVLQVLLVALHDRFPSLCERVTDALLGLDDVNDGEEGEEGAAAHVWTLAEDTVGSRVLEKVLQVVPTQTVSRIIASAPDGRFVTLSTHPVGNFVVQHLLRRCVRAKDTRRIASGILEHFEDILAYNHLGVAASLVAACRRAHTCFKALLQAFRDAFHIESKEQRKLITRLVAYVLARDMYEERTSSSTASETASGGEGGASATPKALPQANYHGSMILQEVWRINPQAVEGDEKERKAAEKMLGAFVRGLLDMDGRELFSLSAHSIGSHIVEGFMASESVSADDQWALMARLEGHYVALATDKYGSHLVERLWARAGQWGDERAQTAIADELGARETLVRESFYGRKVVRNIGLVQFRRRQRQNYYRPAQPQSGRGGGDEASDEIERLFSQVAGGGGAHSKNAGTSARRVAPAVAVDETLVSLLKGEKKKGKGKKRTGEDDDDEGAPKTKKKKKSKQEE